MPRWKSARRCSFALIITLSFIPVFTWRPRKGRMFSPLAFTKTYAMAAAAGSR